MLYLAAFTSAVHVIALGIGLPAIAARWRAFARGDLQAALFADNWWGVAGLLWLASGLARAFGGLEKGSQWYLSSPAFHLKMGVYLLATLLELWPMIVLIMWRIRKEQTGDPQKMKHFARISAVQLGLVVLLPFIAAAMARGVR